MFSARNTQTKRSSPADLFLWASASRYSSSTSGHKFLNYIKSISRREYKSSLRLTLYWGKELVFVKLSVEPVSKRAAAIPTARQIISATQLFMPEQSCRTGLSRGRGDNYSDYAVEYERIVSAHIYLEFLHVEL